MSDVWDAHPLQPICLTHPSTHQPNQLLTHAFQTGVPSFNEPFLRQNFKTNYDVVSYDDHGTGKVKGAVTCIPWVLYAIFY